MRPRVMQEKGLEPSRQSCSNTRIYAAFTAFMLYPCALIITPFYKGFTHIGKQECTRKCTRYNSPITELYKRGFTTASVVISSSIVDNTV